jgi:hypothetical protein
MAKCLLVCVLHQKLTLLLYQHSTRRLEARQETMSAEQRKSIPAVAKKLEAILFVQAGGSLTMYGDLDTLHARFKDILNALLRRRLGKAEGTKMDSTFYRLRVLLDGGVAPPIVRQIYFLVRQIELLQTGKPLDGSGSSAKVSFPLSIEGQQRVPKEVRGIFLDVPIVKAFYVTQLERLGDHNWPRLVKQAIQSIRDYQVWSAVQRRQASA